METSTNAIHKKKTEVNAKRDNARNFV
jgi:hypothetical protein